VCGADDGAGLSIAPHLLGYFLDFVFGVYDGLGEYFYAGGGNSLVD
jgi:hypothetical protein